VDFHQYVRDHLPPLAIAREPEIVDELAQHLADLYAEARHAGLTHEAALARASSALPEYPEDLAREIESASRSLPGLISDRWLATIHDPVPPSSREGLSYMFHDLRRDFRYAVRMLARTPAMTFVIFLTLALGIGANAVIFTAVDAVLLRNAPVADARSLVSVYTGSSDGRDGFSTSSFPDYVDLRDSGTFGALAAYAGIALVLDVNGQSEPVIGEMVSGNYFDVLGVRIPLGRSFRAEEDRAGAPIRVAVISDTLWQTRFGGDATIVGRTIGLNGNAYSVIGVAPQGFGGPIVGRATDAWVPSALQPEVRPPSAGVRRSQGHSNLLGARGLRWLNMIGRLSGGSTIEQASSGANVIAERLTAAYPASNRNRRFTIVALGEGPGVRTSSRPLLRLLSGAVALVLLIACANVASLLLARAVARRREIAVRMAVGAGRARLIRQWLTESVLLALLGSAGGLFLAWWGTPILHTLGIPETIDLSVNPRVLGFTMAIAVASGLVFGLAPIVQTLRKDTIDALRDEGGAVATGARAARMRSAFVVLQVALSLMLLVGAGLFLRTLRNAYAVDLGYPVDQTLLADINLDVRGYTQEAGQSVYEQILSRVDAIPGVVAAGAARVTVLSGGARTTSISIDGNPLAADSSNAIDVRANVISQRYLDAMGIPLVRGRNFAASDRAATPRVAIVSRRLANRLWPKADPIGQKLLGGSEPAEVVGVVPDAVYRSAIETDPLPFFYLLLAQNYESGVTLHIRTAGDPLLVLPAVRQAVRVVDPQLVVARPRLLREEFDRSIGDQRMMATMVGLFGAIALVLAAVGLYGVMAHLASQRRTEIGIRMALGARPSSILRLILGQGLRLVARGSLLGLAGAFAGTRYVQSQLFGVRSSDPATFVGVCAVLIVVSVIACLVPARRAMRVEPAIVLRNA
jgi:putative ABC transport system permease protein